MVPKPVPALLKEFAGQKYVIRVVTPTDQEHSMRKVIRGYASGKDSNLILIGTIPVPHSKDKRNPAARQSRRHLIRQGATIFKKETIRSNEQQSE